MADLSVFIENESAVRSYSRSFPVVFEHARGHVLIDEEGKEYLDFLSGAGTLNYGHNNPVLKRRLVEYIANDGITHGLDLATVAKRTFIESFNAIVQRPRGLDYRLQFTGPTGTNAVEAALKLARQVTGRSNVVAFTHSFHGVSAGSLAVTANRKFRIAAGTPLGNAVFMPYDGYLGGGFDTMSYLELVLRDHGSGLDLPAAVIVETVQGEGGVNAASAEWLRSLALLCRSEGIILIVDDIQAGCGRTGPFFSFEDAGIRPDLVTLSKSLSGYGLPMSLVLIRPDLDIWQPGAHSGTFRGNNLAFACAAAALEEYWVTPDLSRATQRKGQWAIDQLTAIASRYPELAFEVRGRGLMLGLACLGAPQLARIIASKAFALGMIIETSGSEDQVLKLLPPLTIDEDALARGLDIIAACVESAVAQLLETSAPARSLP
jgi:diaminobutyrate-2-oxoglutarate transaminase